MHAGLYAAQEEQWTDFLAVNDPHQTFHCLMHSFEMVQQCVADVQDIQHVALFGAVEANRVLGCLWKDLQPCTLLAMHPHSDLWGDCIDFTSWLGGTR